MKAYIYCLSDSSGIRYIGSTVKRLKTRLSQHLTRCEYRKSPANKWLQSLKAQGKKPTINLILVCSKENRLTYEALITRYYRSCADLLNIKDGTSTEEHRLSMFSYG